MNATRNYLLLCLAFMTLGLESGVASQAAPTGEKTLQPVAPHGAPSDPQTRDVGLAAPANTVKPSRDPKSDQSPDSTETKPVVSGSWNGIRTTTETELGRPITVAIPGLKIWVRSHDYHSLRLYLAGNMLPKVQPTLVSVDQEYANFVLSPHSTDSDDRKSWFGILEEARRQNEGSIPISVGSSTELQPFESHQFIRLKVYPWYTPIVAGGLALLFVALIFLGRGSELLRDGSRSSPGKATYSLGRVQMAWWFYLVVAAYLYLWLITGQVNMLTTSVLALIGISAGTGLSAVFVDQQKQAAAVSQRAELLARQTALQNRIVELQQSSPASGSPLDNELQEKKNGLAQVNASIAVLPTVPAAPVSKGLIDILRDGNGISFSRFQIVVWTVVLGAIFVRAVLKDLTMPDFDSTLLGLMGLSSGTYVGFKFPETPK